MLGQHSQHRASVVRGNSPELLHVIKIQSRKVDQDLRKYCMVINLKKGNHTPSKVWIEYFLI